MWHSIAHRRGWGTSLFMSKERRHFRLVMLTRDKKVFAQSRVTRRKVRRNNLLDALRVRMSFKTYNTRLKKGWK